METIYALNENETLQEIKRPPRIGFIKTFAGATPPEGTLLCDGSAVSRDTYSELFAAIGTTWGSGDGTTTFNLPDLRDQWILCAGTEHEAGDVVAEGLPNVTGEAGLRGGPSADDDIKLVQNRDINPDNTGALYLFLHTNNFYSVAMGALQKGSHVDAINLDLSRGNAIYGASQHVTPASVAVLPCIVYE